MTLDNAPHLFRARYKTTPSETGWLTARIYSNGSSSLSFRVDGDHTPRAVSPTVIEIMVNNEWVPWKR